MIFIFVLFALSLDIQLYYFLYNYGPLYFDYSQNNQFLVKGTYIQDEQTDPIDSDRGVYFSGNTFITQTSVLSQITNWPQEFNIQIWMNPFFNGQFLERQGGNGIFLRCFVRDSKTLYFYYNILQNNDDQLTITKQSSYILNFCKFYLDEWNYLSFGFERSSQSSPLQIYWKVNNNQWEAQNHLDPIQRLDFGDSNTMTIGNDFVGFLAFLKVSQDKKSSSNIQTQDCLNTCYTGLDNPILCSCSICPSFYQGHCFNILQDYNINSNNEDCLTQPYNCQDKSCNYYSCLQCSLEQYPSCSWDSSYPVTFSQALKHSDCQGFVGPSQNQCTSCSDQTKYVQNPPGPCQCRTNTYLLGLGCIYCNQACSTCSNGNSCDTCARDNFIPTGSASPYCQCAQGYFFNSDFSTCQQCHSDCQACNQADACTYCKVQNAVPDHVGCLCGTGSELNTQESACVCKQGYFNNSQQGFNCSLCNQDCLTCTQIGSCETCVGDFKQPTGSDNPYCSCPQNSIETELGCQCQQGQFNQSTWDNSLSCSDCHQDCQNCSEKYLCDTCKNYTQIPNLIQGGCTCPQNSVLNSNTLICECSAGYYNNVQQGNPPECLDCDPQCQTCSNIISCDTCIAHLASPTQIQGQDLCQCSYLNSQLLDDGCACIEGYFNNSEDPDSLNCSPCYWECLTCPNENTCDSCLINYAIPFSDKNGCYCPDNSAQGNTWNSCNCNDGYYAQVVQGILTCFNCNQECSTCQNRNECLTCKSPSKIPTGQSTPPCECDGVTSIQSQLGTCICNSGYYNIDLTGLILNCQACLAACQTCENQIQCLTCKAPEAVLDNQSSKGCSCPDENSDLSSDYLSCECFDGFYDFSSDQSMIECLPCPQQCSTCESFNQCKQCKATFAAPTQGLEELCACTSDYAQIIQDQCRCLDGYYNVQESQGWFWCEACHQDCQTCSDPNQCDSCKMQFAVPATEQGCECQIANSVQGSEGKCKCQDGFFQNPLDSQDQLTCIQCNQKCSTCSSQNECLTCNQMNTSPTGSNDPYCRCADGFYNYSNQQGVLDCAQCDYNCETCQQASSCLTCRATYAIPAQSGDELCECTEQQAYVWNQIGCICSMGFYDSSTDDSYLECTKCHQDCQWCSNGYSCDSCLMLHATPKRDSNGCQCAVENSVADQDIGQCVCQDGYFAGIDQNSSFWCNQCGQPCQTCVNAGFCETCIEKYKIPSSDQWFYCVCPANTVLDIEKGCVCTPGYYDADEDQTVFNCQECPSMCETCQNSDSCLTCADDNAVWDSESSKCVCQPGYYDPIDDEIFYCYKCLDGCQTCQNEEQCLTCTATNSEWDSQTQSCKCIAQDSFISQDGLSCICQDGLYYSDDHQCQPCPIECKTCSSSDSCIQCQNENTQPSQEGDSLCECIIEHTQLNEENECQCKQGYLWTSSQRESCFTCHSDCQSCSQSGSCDSCKAIYATPTTSSDPYCQCKQENSRYEQGVACVCIDGYFNSDLSLQTLNCWRCPSDCQTCSSYNSCQTCKAENATPKISSNGECECAVQFSEFNSDRSACQCIQHSVQVDQEELECVITCDQTCLTCDSWSQWDCLSCYQGWYLSHFGYCFTCEEGQYRLGDFCDDCHKECASCSQYQYCLQCSHPMKTVIQGNCESPCVSGEYLTQTSCEPCPQICQQCSSETQCFQCIPYSQLIQNLCYCNKGHAYNNGECQCAESFYNNSTDIGLYDCQPCYQECLTCSDGNTCDTCVTLNSNPKPDRQQGCQCPQNTFQVNGVCDCVYGVYSASEQGKNCIFLCHESCKSCSGPGEDECTDCQQGVSLSYYNTCFQCERGTYLQWGTLDSCLECGEECQTCTEENYCISCEHPMKIAVQGVCESTCEQGEYITQDSCETCIIPCTTCLTRNQCTGCIEHASLINGVCRCNSGYQLEEQKCEISYFDVILTVEIDNSLILNFEEDLEQILSVSDIDLVIQDVEFEWELSESSVDQLRISFTTQDEIQQSKEISVIFLSSFFSVNNSTFNTSSVSGALNQYFPPLVELPVIEQDKKVLTGTVSFIVSLGMLIGEPMASWAFINYAQVISEIPLSNNNITLPIAQFLSSLSDFSYIPNFYSFLIEDSGISPHQQARKQGYSTSTYLQNWGWQLTILVFGLSINLVLYLATLVRYFRVQRLAKQGLKVFKYSFYIRYFIQVYVDLLIAAILQCMNVRFMQLNQQGFFQTLNLFLGVISLVLLVLCPFYLCMFTYYHSLIITTDDTSDFHRYYGSFFYEFKHEKGGLITYYYVIFLIRRLLYIGSQLIMTSYPIFQWSFGTILQFIVIFIQFTAFLLVMKPFKQKWLQINSALNEIVTCIVFLLCGAYEFEYFSDWINEIDISVVMAILVLILYVTLYSIINCLKLLYRCLEKWGDKKKKEDFQTYQVKEDQIYFGQEKPVVISNQSNNNRIISTFNPNRVFDFFKTRETTTKEETKLEEIST